jgi:hypothetical protein
LATSNFGNVNPGDSQLSFLWFTASSVELADSSAIFSIRFQAIGDVGSQSQIGLLSDPLSLYVESVNGVVDPLLTNATIIITPDCTASDLMITSVNISSDGVATVGVNGGTPPYSFVWSDGSTRTSTNLGVGTTSVSVTVTDAEGCIETASETLTSTSVLSTPVWDVRIVPNPTSGYFSLIMDREQQEEVQIDIFHASGLVVETLKGLPMGNRHDFDLGNLPSGVYILRVIASDGRILTKRIFKLG